MKLNTPVIRMSIANPADRRVFQKRLGRIGRCRDPRRSLPMQEPGKRSEAPATDQSAQ